MDTKGVTTVNVTDPAITGSTAEAPAPNFPFPTGLIPDVGLVGKDLNPLTGYQNGGTALIPLN